MSAVSPIISGDEFSEYGIRIRKTGPQSEDKTGGVDGDGVGSLCVAWTSTPPRLSSIPRKGGPGGPRRVPVDIE